MTRARFDTPGGAAKCTLAASMDGSQTTFTINGDVSNWPTGAGGHHFLVILERGTSRMEKLECTGLSGSSPATITVANRGYDGSVGQTHANGVTAEVGFGGLYLSEHEAHLFDTTRDDHTQYIKTDGTRAFTGLSTIAGTPTSVGTANAAGSASTLAKSDHVHALGAGSVNSSSIIAAGTIVGTNITAGGVGTTQLADSAVTSAKIADGTIATADIASGAVTSALIADGTIVVGDLSATTMPIISVTSTTHPATTTVGNAIVETDTWKLLQYTTSTTGYQPPWNMPWGEQVYSARAAGNYDCVSTTIDLVTGLTFTAVANRVYVFEFHCGQLLALTGTTNGEVWKVLVTDNANTIVEYMAESTWDSANPSSDGSRDHNHFSIRLTGIAAGSHTYKIRGAHIGAHGTRWVSAASGTEPGPMWGRVYDHGPSGNPA